MNTVTRIAMIAGLALACAAGASAQSSSLFLRSQQGQFGSNQPNIVQILFSSPAVGAPAGRTEPNAVGQPTAGAATAATPAGPASEAAGSPAATIAGSSAAPGEVIGSPGAPPTAAQTGGGVPAEAARPYFIPGRPAAPATPVAVPIGAAVGGTGDGTRGEPLSPATAALYRASFVAAAPPQPRQFQVHDLLTIIVREETTFSSDGQTELEKKYSLDAKLEKWIAIKANNRQIVPTAMTDGTPQIKGSADRKVENDGEVKRKDSFIGRLTAEVIDVKPNGTLVISARKFIKTDAEEQSFELTGACRTQDVNADNTVLSTQLADLIVRKTHKGAVADTTKRGIIPWLVDKLNPW